MKKKLNSLSTARHFEVNVPVIRKHCDIPRMLKNLDPSAVPASGIPLRNLAIWSELHLSSHFCALRMLGRSCRYQHLRYDMTYVYCFSWNRFEFSVATSDLLPRVWNNWTSVGGEAVG